MSRQSRPPNYKVRIEVLHLHSGLYFVDFWKEEINIRFPNRQDYFFHFFIFSICTVVRTLCFFIIKEAGTAGCLMGRPAVLMFVPI
jgi:hypothetical protein